MGRQPYIFYIRHSDRALQRNVKSQAALHDLTMSEYVCSVLRYFMTELKTKEQADALDAQRRSVRRY